MMPQKPPNTRTRHQIWPWIVSTLFGLVFGITSAWAVSAGALGYGKVKVGRWSSDPSVGAQAANPWLRARIARVGLLALTKTETLYFDRTIDESGAPLREACTYRITGSAITTRWWSLTIYDSAGYLPRNVDKASSIDATRAIKGGQTSWSGLIGDTAPQGDDLWLSSNAAGDFAITLRLYNPSTIDPEALAKLDFPKIERVSCRDDGEGVAR